MIPIFPVTAFAVFLCLLVAATCYICITKKIVTAEQFQYACFGVLFSLVSVALFTDWS